MKGLFNTKIGEKLKTIFEGKFGDILSNNKLNITLFNLGKNKNEALELRDEKHLVLDTRKASVGQRKLIKDDLLDGMIQSDNEAFLINRSSEKTQRIKNNLPEEEDDDLLKFYKDKLSPEFYKALEASLIIRNATKNKEDISDLKRDIGRKYPGWGYNLCNLVGRDYFHEHFKELYASMLEDKEGDWDIVKYRKKVENIVKSLPYIVFASKDKGYDELSGEVKYKLERLKRYGAGKLLIHGLSKPNVNDIKKVLGEYEEIEGITTEIEPDSTENIITAVLKF